MYAVQDPCGGFLRLRHERRAPLAQGIYDCRTPKVFKLLPIQPGDAWRLLSSWSCSKSSWFCQPGYNSSIANLINLVISTFSNLSWFYSSDITLQSHHGLVIGRSCPGYFKNLNAFLSTRSWFFQANSFLQTFWWFSESAWFLRWNLMLEHACFCKLVLGLFYNIRSWSGWSWHFHARHKFSTRLLVFCKSLFWHISFYDHSECMMVVELVTIVSMLWINLVTS